MPAAAVVAAAAVPGGAAWDIPAGGLRVDAAILCRIYPEDKAKWTTKELGQWIRYMHYAGVRTVRQRRRYCFGPSLAVCPRLDPAPRTPCDAISVMPALMAILIGACDPMS